MLGFEKETPFDDLHEECGVFGIYDFDDADVASTIYYGLFALQHRGQESCGIAVSDTEGPKGKVNSYKGMGLVNEVFVGNQVEELKGNIGVGHVRYSTAGESTIANAQPLVLNYVKGTLALAHNGNLINANQLREELSQTGAIFQTTIDSETIAYYIARERLKSHSVEEAVGRASEHLKGAYSLVIMSPRKLIGMRDPHGFKPLCIGKRDNAYILASESCALDTVGAEFVRDVLPGEIVTISKEEGLVSDTSHCLPKEKQGRCIFEYIYFARQDSYIDGISVHDSRIKAGRFLAQDSPVEADLVVGVPESGNAAAMGYSLESGIPYGTAFVKNTYVGRTFIKPKRFIEWSMNENQFFDRGESAGGGTDEIGALGHGGEVDGYGGSGRSLAREDDTARYVDELILHVAVGVSHGNGDKAASGVGEETEVYLRRIVVDSIGEGDVDIGELWLIVLSGGSNDIRTLGKRRGAGNGCGTVRARECSTKEIIVVVGKCDIGIGSAGDVDRGGAEEHACIGDVHKLCLGEPGHKRRIAEDVVDLPVIRLERRA